MDHHIYNTIRLLIERGKHDLAQQKIKEALTDFPDSADLHALETEVLLEKGEYKSALKSIEQAIGLNPEGDYMHYLRARVSLKLDNDKDALRDMDEAIRINPDMAGYYGMKAAIYINQQQYDMAIAHAQTGLELDPEDLMCNNMLSLAHNKTGKKDEAFTRLENLLADDPENPLTQANAGHYHLQHGNITQAKQHFAAALQSDPGFEYARSGMVTAMKASNFLYAKLLQFSFWVQKIGAKNRWAFFIGLIVVVNVVPFLLPFYLVFIFWAWFTGPLSDVLLYFDKFGKYLMTAETQKLTSINIGFLVAAALALMAGLVLQNSYFTLSFGLFLSIVPVYLFDTARKTAKKVMLSGFTAAFSGIGFYGVYVAYFTNQDPYMAWGALVFSAVIFSWVASIFD
ncbi:MAG: tetratricopeptide repeat protein [Cyclobacteriaceae bacterium]|nr:tetratricopeptide repeat protein [Cyclobacteriaceae bacterium]